MCFAMQSQPSSQPHCACQAEAASLPTMDKLLLRFDGMQSVRKLGEGTFGEAFGTANGVVFKVLPLEGDRLVNGEVQKTAGEILAEAAITLALSQLRQAGRWHAIAVCWVSHKVLCAWPRVGTCTTESSTCIYFLGVMEYGVLQLLAPAPPSMQEHTWVSSKHSCAFISRLCKAQLISQTVQSTLPKDSSLYGN